MPDFILEIGTEELPARFLPGLEQELEEKFSSALADTGLSFSSLNVYTTPRRAAVYIKDLADLSVIKEEVVTGPPVRIAIAPDGTPTKAGQGFAKTQGIDFSAVFTINTEKGEYLAANVKSGGEKASLILTRLCPEIISGLSFPKRMRWGSGDFTFARPLRWLLALLGSELIEFSVGGVESGRTTRGHRVHGHGPFTIGQASDYFKIISEQCKVTVSGTERRQIIIDGGNKLAQAMSGKVLWKESLLDEVQGLCEHPVPLLGNFDPSFLEIPHEVLLTSMQSHQKSFGLEDADGKLLPHFLTVLNITPKSTESVQKGWERVLRARLEDGRFFWKTDLKVDLDTWLGRLDNVIFLAPLGSMGNKTRRISALAGWIADELKHVPNAVSRADAERAGRLSKADLVSEMVGEFDTLQGIMGGIYAARKGENAVVAKAISEQYLPAGPDTPVPSSLAGAIVSIADKVDTLCGCFGLGMIPTGAADPYALRRCALGIARIMLEYRMRFDLKAMFEKAFELYGDIKWKLNTHEALAKLKEFCTLRLKFHLASQGSDIVLVDSVLAAGDDDIWAASERLNALRKLSTRADFAEGVQTFKRVANIIRKQAASIELSGKYDKALLTEPAEQALAGELEKNLSSFKQLWADEKFDELFELLFTLKPAVDDFFNNVMVMCEDQKIRESRLNLLKNLVDHLSKLADFDALQI